MTPDLARFIVNTRETFSRLTDQQLYQLVVSLAAELHERHVDAEPEARALCAALLAHAQVEHRAIYSADCPASPPPPPRGAVVFPFAPYCILPAAE
jgi:hypothetical protein